MDLGYEGCRWGFGAMQGKESAYVMESKVESLNMFKACSRLSGYTFERSSQR